MLQQDDRAFFIAGSVDKYSEMANSSPEGLDVLKDLLQLIRRFPRHRRAVPILIEAPSK
jgi:hypothetical protein